MNFMKYQCACVMTEEKLGHAIGRDFRASVAVLDEGFADNILKHLEQSDIDTIA